MHLNPRDVNFNEYFYLNPHLRYNSKYPLWGFPLPRHKVTHKIIVIYEPYEHYRGWMGLVWFSQWGC